MNDGRRAGRAAFAPAAASAVASAAAVRPKGVSSPQSVGSRAGVGLTASAARSDWVTRFGDMLLLVWCLALAGYAVGGRSFAYLGVAPLFVGEALLGALVLYLFCVPGALLGRVLVVMSPVLLLVGWCAQRAASDFGKYGIDTLRDSAQWYYAVYAFVIVALLLSRPQRIVAVVGRYQKFLKFFLLFGVIGVGLSRAAESVLPPAPWAPGVPLISVRPGDSAVHLAGAFAFVALAGGVPILRAAVMIPLGLAFCVSSRAALLSFVVPGTLIALYRPFNRVGWTLLLTSLAMVAVAWIFNIRVATSGYEGREFSVDTLVESVASVISSDQKDKGAMDTTKQWRLAWWDKIIGYTFDGPYYWTGKGYGINLATDDGFQVDADDALRSPHNGHLTYLARAGVPGLVLWIGVNLYWLGFVLGGLYRTHRARHTAWATLLMVILCYWIALMINAAFDVFLEGPMGGIWYWSIYGLGIAAVLLQREQPQVLQPASAAAASVAA